MHLAVKYAHIDPITDFHILFIPRAIFQDKDFQFCTLEALKSLINIKAKVTEVKTQFNCFWTITTVWIDMWQWDNAQSLMRHREGAPLFLKVIHQISRLRGTKNLLFFPELGVSGL